MAGISLYDYQKDALKRMKTGCILCGKVGSGKSRTALAYYYIRQGGRLSKDSYIYMRSEKPKDLYIITTARKRDTCEWEAELAPFLLSKHPESSAYKNKVVIDSWNNIRKYDEVKGAFFIFDEQRVVGRGAWVKAFLRIAKANEWILLSATPGDCWNDYVPVFIANGFFRNRSEFEREHAVYSRFSKYPKIDHYINTGKLVKYRKDILVEMDYRAMAVQHHETIPVGYDLSLYKQVGRTRWDPYKDQPIPNAGSLCYVWRKVVNSDESRVRAVRRIVRERGRVIIFYNFDYELEILRNVPYGRGVRVAEWNGHIHEPIPDSQKWVYLVQYTAGCEGWNCIKTDTTIFYSLNYSYKVMEQATGRINRLNTPYKDLYYYYLESKSGIDRAIGKALKEKRNFNEGKFVRW